MSTTAAREVETVWCENAAHDGGQAHFVRDDCEHPHFTDQRTRALMNRGARTAHVADLEACYTRALDAMAKVQVLRDQIAGCGYVVFDVDVITSRLDEALAAFAGGQS